ncbi:tetratricopeptide repeat protein [Leptolyngbya sp. PCC 6406]|uniref:tetratricopeptide repeat protein n=1 Tax=Leptolyngbya sp. PCC 6406 TaxID=1173264 RepID=UPI0002E9FAB4|nr:tetratricopeptide repeat protein [Leptolyngbya sp. PCC 6406]
MAPSEGSLQPGTIADISRRLALWAQRDSSGLVRVEYSSEFARQQVMQRLQALLTPQGIPLKEIGLPPFQEAETVVQTLVTRLEEIATQPSTVVSVTGFATAFSRQSPEADALRVLNFNRDRYVTLPLRQIWWMTPAFMQKAIHAMPDLNSFFLQRLQLTEVILPEATTPQLRETDGSTTHIDDARQRAHGLIRQFEIAKTSNASPADLLSTYILPALEALAEVGAQKELRDLTQQFEGILSQIKVADSVQLASSLARLANLYNAQGRYGEAEPLYQKALTLCQRLLGSDHPDTASSLNNLAGLYESQGRYGEAEPLYLQALEIRRSQLGSDHPNTATSLNNLAELYRAQGRYGEVKPLLQKALEIRRSQLGTDHPDTAQSLNNLAGLYESQGHYGEAEPLFQQALEITRSQSGSDHPNTATSLNNLAGLYYTQGRYGEAEPLYLQALEIRRSQLGSEHPDTASSLNNLAELYRAQERYGEAEPLYLQAWEIFMQTLGKNHPNTQIVLKNFVVYLRQIMAAGQVEMLSDHPITRELLKQLS